MAYSKGDRFPPQPRYYRFLDPCSYQNGFRPSKGQCPAPFLSKAPRVSQPSNRVYTDAIYDAALPPKIQKCTSFMAKCPRFPYEALSKEDIEEILCKCGINVCECHSEENVIEHVCQGLVPRRLFKGNTLRSELGPSKPSQRDRNASPPFYDIRVDEATAFYRGCKWSHRTTKRSSQSLEQRPGPADYYFEREPTQAELCLEKLRFNKKKNSKQLRNTEMLQQRDIREGRPGPATYFPKLPKGPELGILGPKADRFPPESRSELRPGPADHEIERDFDLRKRPLKPCLFKLPEYCGFGKAARFKSQCVVGPGPDTYSINDKHRKFMHCPNGAFNSTAVRFKQEPIDEGNDSDDDKFIPIDDSVEQPKKCPNPTWGFKSKTVRMRPLKVILNEQSPADMPQTKVKAVRSKQLQYTSPFFSSESRFRPWYDWLPVYASVVTPGPGYYNLEKPKCNPAVCRGPLVRTQRFPPSAFQSPAPNEYTVGRGLETVLDTHNAKLKLNIENQHKFHWEPPVDYNMLNIKQREAQLLHNTISMLDNEESNISKPPDKSPKAKMLRYFLYDHQIPMPS